MLPAVNLKALNAECGAALHAAYHRVLDSDCLILGREVSRFERTWAEYCEMQFCVGTGNGYDALRLMLIAHGISEKDTVAVAGNTHISTWLAVRSVGATLLPVEPNEKTHCIGGEEIRATPGAENITAILGTHLYGGSAPIKGLRNLADELDSFLFFDACQAHGVKELGDASAFSFYPTKNLGALGDGGAVVTNDPAVYAYLHALRNYGRDEDEYSFIHPKGCNSRLDELQAAFLYAKFLWLEEWNGLRALHAARYIDQLGGLGLVLPEFSASHVWHQFVVTHPDRNTFRRRLQARGISTLIHYPIPPHAQPAFASWNKHPLPISSRLASQVISLPVGPEMRPEHIEQVIEAVKWCA